MVCQQWQRCAEKILSTNQIPFARYAAAIYRALKEGCKDKTGNPYFIGESDVGKSFLLAPIKVMYTAFTNPAGGPFSFCEIQGHEVVVLNEWDGDPKKLGWDAQLLWMEGEPVRFPRPRSFFKTDFVYKEGAPIFLSGAGKVMHRCKIQTDMMSSRMDYFHLVFKVVNPDRTLPCCTRCFYDFIEAHRGPDSA